MWFIVHAYPVLKPHTAHRFDSLGLSAKQILQIFVPKESLIRRWFASSTLVDGL